MDRREMGIDGANWIKSRESSVGTVTRLSAGRTGF
jgi:hypothetical protein